MEYRQLTPLNKTYFVEEDNMMLAIGTRCRVFFIRLVY
jgi:hypothetical protein